VGQLDHDNLWAIKAIFNELVSGLRDNFHKSTIYGVNADQAFLPVAEAFLNCRVSELPFKFLGIPIGSNPRLVRT